MKTIKAIPVTEANFAPYGYLADIANPQNAYGLGDYPCTFHRDIALAPMASTAPIAFGSLKVGRRSMIIKDVEYHTLASEVMMPFDCDMVMYVGPANSGEPEPEKLEAFVIPKGTLLVFRAGMWHGAPFPLEENGTVLICLPERTYLNDTTKLFLDEKDFISIEL
jgi:ureidoglycolate hydrolase